MVREAFVEGGGRPTRYLEAGAGWPVVLVHAFPMNADMWRPQLERVPDGWRYIAPDLPGFGKSDSVAPPTTVDAMAQSVAAVMDDLGIDPAVIGGLSMGGYVTFALYRRQPERFTAMILADTRPQADTEEGREGRRKMIGVLKDGGVRAVADQMVPKLLGETSRRDRPDVVREARRIAEANAPGAVAAALEAMMTRPDSTGLLPRISCPVLIAVGDEDVITPMAEAESMQRALGRSRLVVLPGAGHLSNMETPDAFSDALADFVASNL
jgi:3-oxoadipate enol-lactonase